MNEDTKKQVRLYYDVYGYNLIKTMLSRIYGHFSYCNKSLATAGSPYYPVCLLNDMKSKVVINKVVIHSKVDSVSLFTDFGVIRFWD